jgi:hypothetical protein
VVLTASAHATDPVWNAAQDRMARLSTNSSHRRADASHAGLLEEAAGAQQSVRAVVDVVRAARTGTALPPA